MLAFITLKEILTDFNPSHVVIQFFSFIQSRLSQPKTKSELRFFKPNFILECLEAFDAEIPIGDNLEVINIVTCLGLFLRKDDWNTIAQVFIGEQAKVCYRKLKKASTGALSLINMQLGGSKVPCGFNQLSVQGFNEMLALSSHPLTEVPVFELERGHLNLFDNITVDWASLDSDFPGQSLVISPLLWEFLIPLSAYKIDLQKVGFSDFDKMIELWVKLSAGAYLVSQNTSEASKADENRYWDVVFPLDMSLPYFIGSTKWGDMAKIRKYFKRK